MNVKVITSIFILLLVLSCKHDPFPYNEPADVNTDNPSDTCDMNLVYFDQVKITIAGCSVYGCHDAGPNESFSLLNHQDIVDNLLKKDDISNWTESKLYEVLVEKANDLGERMPPPPRAALDQSTIDLLKTWVLQGATNVYCGKCDTVSVGYASHIKSLIAVSCKSCHMGRSTSFSIDFSTYSLAVVNASNMLERMERGESSNGFMPDNGLENNCNIELMRLWIQNNYPN